MVFSSITFLYLFLPIFLLIYFITKNKYKNHVILIMSLIFYFHGEGIYVIIMIVYMVFNYIFGLYIEKHRSFITAGGDVWAKRILVISLIFNLGLLVFFKYFNFILENLNIFLSTIGLSYKFPHSPVHLPIGISFFTFQAVSYVIDVYRKDVHAQGGLINFSMYKALFPQLIAGPIVRYKDISEQVTGRTVTYEKFAGGIERFLIGLAKKVLIANNVGEAADIIFNLKFNELSFDVAWLGVLCYSLQIYFDFSGYSDMAIGLGKMMGFDFLENFNYPYISKSIKEFWRRWHISLSSWFRDYLYLPLGGNRHGEAKTYVNLFLVFFFCGLWHGASWLFVIWGCWHGIFLILERVFLGRILSRISPFIQHGYTILIIMTGWVFFRAHSVNHSIVLLENLFGFNGITTHNISAYINTKVLLAIISGMIFATPVFKYLTIFIAQSSLFKINIIRKVMQEMFKWSLIILLIICTVVLSSSTFNPFIYFRF